LLVVLEQPPMASSAAATIPSFIVMVTPPRKWPPSISDSRPEREFPTPREELGRSRDPKARAAAPRRLHQKGTQTQIQVTFRELAHSDAIEAYVRKHAAKLERFSGRITGCHVVLEEPHRHQLSGRHFRVRIDLVVPGGEVVVSQAPDGDATSEDAYAAIDQAFDRSVRRLEDFERRRSRNVRRHATAREASYIDGRVAKLWSYEGFGFIEARDGAEVYFHRNSVLGGAFDRLAVGARVRFVEEEGDKGPQASTVMLR
jgi:ribosomal subunit interface protein